MKACVVYESLFGNTRQVATQIADGLSRTFDVRVSTTTDTAFEDVASAALVVVGGPTHAHGLSSPATREAAASTAEEDPALELEGDPASPGLREWVKTMPDGCGQLAAAFDTRLDKSAIFTGSAAKTVSKRLRRRGYDPLADPESFRVEDTEGPLVGTEAERARAWGEYLAEQCLELARNNSHRRR